MATQEISMTFEHWLPITGYPMYFISNLGNVLSLKKRGYRLLKMGKSGDGYYSVRLYKPCGDRVGKVYKVHRLVADAFLAKKDPTHTVVNHKDGDKHNDRVDNLEWCTYAENVAHAKNVLGCPFGGLRSVKVLCVETGEIFDSMTEVTKKIGIPVSGISRATKSNYRAGGCHWKNVEEDKA